MNSLKKIIILFLCAFVMNVPALAGEPIKIEVKVFGTDVIFVFYHPDDQIIDLSSRDNQVFANINIPIEYSIVNQGEFGKYASNPRLANNKQTIIFNIVEELEYQSIINGERLDAIKFKSGQKKEEDLSTIGAANNDPDAITYQEKDGDHQLTFNLETNDSKAASFVRGKYLWVVFDQKKLFTFSEEAIFQNFVLIPSENGTVLRFKLTEGYPDAKLVRVNNGWAVTVTKDFNNGWKKQLELNAQPLIDEDGHEIFGDFSDHEIIQFEDSEVGDTIKVVPVRSSGARVILPVESVEYNILKTGQGIAVSILSDDVEFTKLPDRIKIIADSDLPDDVLIETNLFPVPIDEYFDIPTVLPYIDKNLNILDFNERKTALLREAVIARDDEEAFNNNLELAKFYFIHGLYHETADVMEYLKKHYPEDYSLSLPGRFLNAVAHTLIGEHLNAKDEYDALLSYYDVRRIPEINLWSKYNNHALGGNPGSIGFMENHAKSISLYSDDKYWPLAFAEIELGLFANDLKHVDKIFRELRNPPEGRYANSLKYYKANYYRKKGQTNLAKQFLLDLKYREEDLFNSTRAGFDLVKLKMDLEEIDLEHAIETLNDLRFRWRGDQLEYEILIQLANYYRQNRDILNAMRTFQYVQTAFSNKVSNFYVTSEMAKIFNDVFLPGGLGEEMDDFTLVALFFEFKELNPIGEKGDDVILGIARRLVRLDLLDNAAELLRHQIKFRLKGDKRVANADNLAVILMMDKKPREALIILDETDKDNFDFEEHQYRVRLRARAMIDLENYQQALKLLKADETEDAEVIRREALFRDKKWSEYSDRINSQFDATIQQVGSSEAASQDILRLAISYYMLGYFDQLQMISSSIGSKNQILRDTIDLLSTTTGAIDVKNLDQSLNIDQMEGLLNKYKNQFLAK